jgi:hypothetical protein
MPHLRPGQSQTVKLGCRQQRPLLGLRHGRRQNASHGPRARAAVSAAHPRKSSCSGVPRSHIPWRMCICRGTRLAPPTSAPGLGSPVPNLHRNWARPCAPAEGLGSPHPHLRRDWAHPCHICTGTGLAPAHLQRDLARPCRSCDLVTLRIDRSRCAQSRLGACHARVPVLVATFLVCQFSDQLVALGLEACVLLEPLRAIM